jgi:hypothetical protein
MNSRLITTIARYLQGISFFVFGLNGFLHFIPQPPGTPEAMIKFGGALMATGYMMPLIKGTEVLAGVLLLSNRYVPLALTLLAPVLVNIVAAHAFLAPNGLALGLILFVLNIFLAYQYRASFAPMLQARVEPAPANVSASSPVHTRAAV